MNRYYLVNVSGPANRWTQVVDALVPVPGRRELPHDLLHWRTSLDNTLRIVQSDTDDAEHASLILLAWVSLLGGFDEATGLAGASVHAYLAANSAAWERPIGV